MMQFSVKHMTGHDSAECRMLAEGISVVLLLDEYASLKSFEETLTAYGLLNNLAISAEVCGDAVELSCGHGLLARFTPIN